MDARTSLMVGVLAAQAVVAMPALAEPRPQVSSLRLSERDILLRFTREVQADPILRQRAMVLWETHFAAQADELRGRFKTDEDWRPVLADAAELVDEFLEASLLPRAGEMRAEGMDGQAGKVWVETLDPRTGQRVRQLRDAARRPRLLAPTGGDDAKPGQPKPTETKGLRVEPAPKPAR
jgi:hypothetical protein